METLGAATRTPNLTSMGSSIMVDQNAFYSWI